MERATGHVVTAAFFQPDTPIDHIDDIDAFQQVINKGLGDQTSHCRIIQKQEKPRTLPWAA